MLDGKLWISGPLEGEGGSFNIDDFEKVIEKFYNENF